MFVVGAVQPGHELQGSPQLNDYCPVPIVNKIIPSTKVLNMCSAHNYSSCFVILFWMSEQKGGAYGYGGCGFHSLSFDRFDCMLVF